LGAGLAGPIADGRVAAVRGGAEVDTRGGAGHVKGHRLALRHCTRIDSSLNSSLKGTHLNTTATARLKPKQRAGSAYGASAAAGVRLLPLQACFPRTHGQAARGLFPLIRVRGQHSAGGGHGSQQRGEENACGGCHRAGRKPVKCYIHSHWNVCEGGGLEG
jgi:hypothetical protein